MEPNTPKQPECLEHNELKSCDRCLLRCSKIFWGASNVDPPTDTKDSKAKLDDQQPGTSSNYFLTAGQMLETGSSGKNVFKLSQQISKAPSLTPKRRHHVLNQSWKSVQLIDREFENLRNLIYPLLLQRIDSRQQGVLQGTSDEFKNAITSISNKYRERRAEVNSNCFAHLENLRRQLRADIEMEEKLAAQKTGDVLTKRLKDVEEKLKQLGCVGPDFIIPETDVAVHQSSLCRIEYDNKYGTSMLPVPERLVKCVKDAEKEELQNFLLYARMSNQPDDEDPLTKKRFKIEPVAAGIDGLIDLNDDDEEND